LEVRGYSEEGIHLVEDEVKERNLKYIEEISTQLEDDFLGTTQEERDLEREEFIEKSLPIKPVFENGGNGDADQGSESSEAAKPSKANLILSLIEKSCSELFTDEYDVPHAAVTVKDHVEVLSIRSRRFRNWAARTVYKEAMMVIDSQTIKDVIGVLSAKAEFEGEQKSLNLRVASFDNKWYYDLTNSKWEFIEISSEGWKLVKQLIMFRRFGQLPQGNPSITYPLDIFDRFMNLLNIKGDENRLLLKCYIISMFIPGVPKVILMLHGEQGSAKTTLEELIKMLVDPSIVKTFAFPKDINEFIQQLAHNYVTFYDNISTIRDWISDLLCRAVTGSDFSKRVLYTDDDDFIYSLKRCVGFNGINLGATKADLLDRGLIIQLERVTKDKWRKIEDIWKEFEEIRPKLLGYIFNILVKLLAWKKEGKSLNLTLSRMADWTEYGEMIARCMGYEEKEFLTAYYNNLELQTEEVLESSPVALTLIDFMVVLEEESHSDSATKWLSLLELRANTLGINTQIKSWPKSASHLSRKLKELVTTLREIGIEIEWLKTRTTRTRVIKVRKLPSLSSLSSGNENQAQNSERKNDNEGGKGGKGGKGDTFRHLLGPPPDRPKAFRQEESEI
jgi:hypothetical protein